MSEPTEPRECAFRQAHIEMSSPAGTAEGTFLTEPYSGPNELFANALDALRRGDPQAFISYATARPRQRNARVLRYLAICHNMLGEAERASQFIDESILLYRAEADAEGLALALTAASAIASDVGDKIRAWQLLDAASDLIPDDASIHYNRVCLASVCRDRPKLESAVRELEKNTDWASNAELCDLMRRDAELRFLRCEVPKLWESILSRMENARGDNR